MNLSGILNQGIQQFQSFEQLLGNGNTSSSPSPGQVAGNGCCGLRDRVDVQGDDEDQDPGANPAPAQRYAGLDPQAAASTENASEPESPAPVGSASPPGERGRVRPASHARGRRQAPAASASDSNSSTPEASPSSATGQSQSASPGTAIGPGSKVLEIGDSHTVGTFGHDLDSKLRGTGAQVATYASAGASASWFKNGHATKYGYWEKHADGSQETANYGQSHATPKLEQLIQKEKPSVILVNLGANFRDNGAASIQQEVDSVGQIAKNHNIPVIWVGPPRSGKDGSRPGALEKFDQEMQSFVSPYGKYVASSQFTPRYAGGDGTHYTGREGTQLAHEWADGVFNEITRR